MTCIVGLIDKNQTIYIGGDSAASDGASISLRKDPKVFIKKDFIYGYTSSFRMGDIIQYSFKEPKINPNQSLEEYMRTNFIDELRNCLAEKGFARKDEGEESAGTFLVGVRGRLFIVEDDFQVGEHIYSFDACGGGKDVALGSLHSTHKLNLKPEIRVNMALEAAAEFNPSVREPFTILSLKYKKGNK